MGKTKKWGNFTQDLKGPHFDLNIIILKINGSTSRLSIITK